MKIIADKKLSILLCLGLVVQLVALFLLVKTLIYTFTWVFGIDYFMIIFLSIFILAVFCLTVAGLYIFIYFAKMITIGKEGIKAKFLWMKTSCIQWPEVEEIGVGSMTPQWSNVRYIYVSKRKITDKERTQITDTGIKYRHDMIFMKYSAEIYEYIRSICPDKVHTSIKRN